MTKTVRIENADTNTSVKVRVKAQHKNLDGEWVDAEEAPLEHPTAMATVTIHDSKRLIVEEYKD